MSLDPTTTTFLYELLNTPSPTGFEVRGQRVWAKRCREFADSVESDAYGNAWATVRGSEPDAPRVMIEAHADEIGFIVKYIADDGFLRVDRIGGSDWANARGRRLTVFGDQGEVLGIIGNGLTMAVLVHGNNNSLKKQSTIPFLISLTVSDFIFCAFNLPLTAARYLGIGGPMLSGAFYSVS